MLWQNLGNVRGIFFLNIADGFFIVEKWKFLISEHIFLVWTPIIW